MWVKHPGNSRPLRPPVRCCAPRGLGWQLRRSPGSWRLTSALCPAPHLLQQAHLWELLANCN
eukprot:129880-Lingulodinium_polyedra.AAC.1